MVKKMFLSRFLIKNLDKAEVKTKTQWLIVTYFSNVLFPLLTCGNGIYVYMNRQDILPYQLTALLGMYPTLVFWFTSYKRPGTRLLHLNLWISPFAILVGTIQAFFRKPSHFQIIEVIVDFCLSVWVYWLCLKVKKINEKWRAQNALHQSVFRFFRPWERQSKKTPPRKEKTKLLNEDKIASSFEPTSG
jgi:hypothetical protein